MRYKIFPLLVIWLFGVAWLPAQTVLPTQDIYWEEATFTIAGSFLRYRLLCGDTTINDESYAKIYDIVFPFDGEQVPADTMPPPVYAGALRVAGEQVLYISPGETDFKLLYDFSLEVEEEIELPNITQGNEGSYTVTEIDSVEVNGVMRKRIKLNNIFGDTDDVWIEGLGSVIYGLLDRGLSAVLDYGSDLRCIGDLTEGFTFRPSSTGPCTMAISGCDLINTAVDRTPADITIRSYPNPLTDHLWVELPADGAEWRIELWSFDGRRLRVWSPSVQGYRVEALPAGMYFLKVIRDQQYVYGDKLIKQ